jgi:hypothetical protein
MLAREFNVPIRCVRFTASTRLAEHNDAARALNPNIVCIYSTSSRLPLSHIPSLYQTRCIIAVKRANPALPSARTDEP